MQNLIQKITLGFSIIALPFLSTANYQKIINVQPIPKDAKSLIHKTKEISLSEANATNFTGVYSGKRYQYNADHSQILRTYTYSMDIVQKDNQITGVTNILADNGDYAVIKLRGIVIGTKLYFEEYAIQDQKKSDEMVWCFKVGELQLGKNNGNTVVYGPTNSYTSVYYQPCTGGYTVLQKEATVKSNNSNAKESNQLSNVEEKSKLEVLLYPNPFITNLNVSYTVSKDAQVQIELFDINGRMIQSVLNEKQISGEHNIQIDGSKLTNGVYVVKININGVITSKQVVKSAYN